MPHQPGPTNFDGLSTSELAHACLAELLRTESDDDVVAQIVHGLGTMSDPRTLPLMLPLCSHPCADVRWQVASTIPSAVVHEEDPQATAALIRLSGDPDDEVRNWATFGLGTQLEDVDNPELRAALLDRIDDHHDETRCEALVGLALRGDGRILPALHAAVEGRGPGRTGDYSVGASLLHHLGPADGP